MLDEKDKYISINDKYINLATLPKNIITLKDVIEYSNYSNSNSNSNNNDYEYDYYIMHHGKIISKSVSISSLFKLYQNQETISINIIQRVRGGGLFDMFASIIKIGEVFIFLGDCIVWLGKFIFWFLKFIAWVFIDLLNPAKLATDFFGALMVITISICRIPFDIILSVFTIGTNLIGGWLQGFWGWDQSSLTVNDRNSKYFKNINRNKGSKCYLTNSNTVPFSIILGTILCPPLGVFMDLGITGWLNIIICILLTLLFYLPGLVYALLIIYS